jgi:hypothetical protein
MKTRYFARVTVNGKPVKLYRFAKNGNQMVNEQWTGKTWTANEAAEIAYARVMFKGEPLYDEYSEGQAKKMFPAAFS